MIKTLQLKRQYLSKCTMGEFYFEGERLLFSIERPWLSNEPFKSCIPPGIYKIGHHNSERHPNSFYLENENLGVSYHKKEGVARYGILIHIANRVDEVVGCIGPGKSLLNRNWGVGSSTRAMKQLNGLIKPNKDWELEIMT